MLRADVYVNDQKVARLSREGDFKHILAYEGGVNPSDFISLTMPVRDESWVWPELHPVFQMNLPEGFLLSLLQESLGPLLDGTDLTLLSIVGRNSIGRVRVVPEGESPESSPELFDLSEVLHGDNSEKAFVELVRRHVTSGVSGVVPKFLSPVQEDEAFQKISLHTGRSIIKGSSFDFPGLALNEHFTMEVARRAKLNVAGTAVSDDGRALVVSRFDLDAQGKPLCGMEDFCALLGMKPQQKYDTTWERIAKALNAYVPSAEKHKEQERLLRHIVLTYMVRNADCHSKNVALTYTSTHDVSLAPVYDVVTTVAYAGLHNSFPGISLGGRKTWHPDKSLEFFAQQSCNIQPKRLKETVEETAQAMVEVAPEVVYATKQFPEFHEVGKRMLLAWEEGINSLRANTMSFAEKPGMKEVLENAHFSDPAPETQSGTTIGRSELLGKR